MKSVSSLILIIEKPPWKDKEDHTSATNGSLTFKTFKVFLRNLTRRDGNLVTEDLRKIWYEVRGEFFTKSVIT